MLLVSVFLFCWSAGIWWGSASLRTYPLQARECQTWLRASLALSLCRSVRGGTVVLLHCPDQPGLNQGVGGEEGQWKNRRGFVTRCGRGFWKIDVTHCVK